VIRAVGAKLFYLPPYSPDLNPIEQAFAKLKTLLPKANARSFEQVQVAIAHLLRAITPDDCRSFFAYLVLPVQQLCHARWAPGRHP
jgi:transposase